LYGTQQEGKCTNSIILYIFFLLQKHSTEIGKFTEQLLTRFGFFGKPNLTLTATDISTIYRKEEKKEKCLHITTEREREGKMQ
jgi:hypothetical protein